MYLSSMTKAELASFIKLTISEAINENKKLLNSLFPKIDEEYCTIVEVSKKFKVTKATVHNWAKAGTIKKHKINGRTLYKLSEIEKSIN